RAGAPCLGILAPSESREKASVRMTERKTSGATQPEPPSILRRLIVLGSAVYAAALAGPAAAFLVSGGGRDEKAGGRARWIRVARLAELGGDEPKRVPVISDERDAFTVTKDELLGSVWLIRNGDTVVAFSATCPHLGCSVDLGTDKKSFACPCHTSRF